MLSKIKTVFKSVGKEVLGVIVFGSYIYSPLKSHDIDLLIIINSLKDINEKINLEVKASIELKKVVRKPIDVHIFDFETFRENLEPGSFLSGLTLGYRILYDKVNLVEVIREFIRKISETEEYIYMKKRVWNLALIAKTKIRV